MKKVLSADVVVLGAGMAGLRATQVLREKRPDWTVLLLEARSVVGGRVRWTHLKSRDESDSSCRSDDAPLYIDEGAQFIHGVAEKHPLCQLAVQHQLAYRNIKFTSKQYYWPRGGPKGHVVPPERLAKVQKATREIQRKVQEWQEEPINQGKDVPLQSLVDDFLPQV